MKLLRYLTLQPTSTQLILNSFGCIRQALISQSYNTSTGIPFEVNSGIIIGIPLLIEPLQFYVFKRLNMFISSNLTFCIPFNSIFIYYNNLIFSIFSFGTGLLGLYVRAESQIYLIGYYFPFSYKLRLLLLILSFLVYKINLKYIERYQKPNVLEISIPYNFYIISSLFAISSNNFISFYLSLELQSLS